MMTFRKLLSGPRGLFSLSVGLMLFSSCGMPQPERRISTPIYYEGSEGKFEIPAGYKTYTLFIATSYSYVKRTPKKDMADLKGVIKKFGESIGEGNLAVWAGNPEEDSLNVEIGKTYADRVHKWYGLKLDYNDGPFLIFLK